MMGQQPRGESLFYYFRLEDQIPQDHLDALLSSYEMACEATPLEGSCLVVEEVPVLVFCRRCDAQRPVHSTQMFCCSECGTPTGEVVQGKELLVVGLEVEE
jgi:hydrogenase nickel incorporation protein HypA/HybF